MFACMYVYLLLLLSVKTFHVRCIKYNKNNTRDVSPAFCADVAVADVVAVFVVFGNDFMAVGSKFTAGALLRTGKVFDLNSYS